MSDERKNVFSKVLSAQVTVTGMVSDIEVTKNYKKYKWVLIIITLVFTVGPSIYTRFDSSILAFWICLAISVASFFVGSLAVTSYIERTKITHH